VGGEGGAGLRFGQVNEVETRNSAPGTRVCELPSSHSYIFASKTHEARKRSSWCL